MASFLFFSLFLFSVYTNFEQMSTSPKSNLNTFIRGRKHEAFRWQNTSGGPLLCFWLGIIQLPYPPKQGRAIHPRPKGSRGFLARFLYMNRGKSQPYMRHPAARHAAGFGKKKAPGR
jgi:hypothetical protein